MIFSFPFPLLDRKKTNKQTIEAQGYTLIYMSFPPYTLKHLPRSNSYFIDRNPLLTKSQIRIKI